MMRVTRARNRWVLALGLILGLGPVVPGFARGQTPAPAVHAILFYSPTCPHCHALIRDHLIPLQEEYGPRLVILAFDVSQSWANELYWSTLRHYEIPQEDWVVPIMILRDEVLIGGIEIPAALVQALEEELAGGGVDLPNVPALLAFLDEQGMLDHRFPERRVVVQNPPQDQPDAGVDSLQPDAEADSLQPEAGTDALQREAPTAPADSVLVAEEVPIVSDTPGVPEEAVAQGMERTEEREPPDPAGGEPAGMAPDSQATGAGPGGEPEREAVEAPVPDTAAAAVSAEADWADPGARGPDSRIDSVQGAGSGTDPAVEGVSTASPTPGGEPSAGESGGDRRPTDLAGAAREMESMSMIRRFNQDRAGNAASVLVLLAMVISVVLKGYPPRRPGRPWPAWVIPVLVVVGAGVAGYLSFIEITHTEAVCGPVGDCNTVNQSEYARLFGVIPVGILGLLGYPAVLALWAVGRAGPERLRGNADLGLWGAALFGTLFSVYLTFLEPFVIGATCAWCLSSALIMMLLLWASTPLAARAWPGAVKRRWRQEIGGSPGC